MDALVFEEGAVLQHALNKGRALLEEHEKMAKLVAELSYKNKDLEAQVKDLSDILAAYETKIDDLSDTCDKLINERDNCQNAVYGYITECEKLEKERDELVKELREARKEYDDLNYSKIICPGKAAKYYLEGYRKLIKENNTLKEDNDDLKKLYEKILVLTDKTTDMVIAVIDQKSREEHTP